jgi:gluconate 5-dehydrogenase
MAGLEETEPTTQSLFDLSGRTSLVTGAAGYLGGAMARALAESGSRVVVTSRDAGRARAVAEALPDPRGLAHFGVALDQIESDSIERAFAEILRQTDRVDVLVNNANEASPLDLTNVDCEAFNRQLANATGYFLLARMVRDRAVAQRAPASVIMLGSMYGLVGSYPSAYEDIGPASPVGYHALKGGIIQMTRHLAVYWAGDRVRVNCLSPGPFPSPAAPSGLVERLQAHSPMGRMGRPHELKGAVVFLAADASSYVTGQNLVVDGGWTAW